MLGISENTGVARALTNKSGFRNGPFVVKLQSSYRRCQALASCPWSTKGRRHDVIRFIGGQSKDTWSAPWGVRLPDLRPYPIMRPSSGTFGVKRLDAAPNSVTQFDVTLKLSPIARSCGRQPLSLHRCDDHAVCSWPQRKSVSSIHIRCRITASLRATATLARFIPRRLAIFSPQHFRLEKR